VNLNAQLALFTLQINILPVKSTTQQDFAKDAKNPNLHLKKQPSEQLSICSEGRGLKHYYP